jgi:hypothetical protein
MATKKGTAKKTEAKAEEPVVEKKVAPVKEAPKKAAPAPKAPKALKADLSLMPNADTHALSLPEFIKACYKTMLGREATEKEMEHHTRTVERHKRPHIDIQIDIKKGGEYQTLHALVPEGTLLGE